MAAMAYRFAPLAGIAIAILASAFLLGISALSGEAGNHATHIAAE